MSEIIIVYVLNCLFTFILEYFVNLNIFKITKKQ